MKSINFFRDENPQALLNQLSRLRDSYRAGVVVDESMDDESIYILRLGNQFSHTGDGNTTFRS